MEREGYLEKRRGLGTYLTEDMNKWEGIRVNLARHALHDFLQTMTALGYSEEMALRFFEKYLKEGI